MSCLSTSDSHTYNIYAYFESTTIFLGPGVWLGYACITLNGIISWIEIQYTMKYAIKIIAAQIYVIMRRIRL